METQEDILQFLKTLKPKLSKDGIKTLGLFGSFAKNENNRYSDIDIVYESSETFREKFKGWTAFTYLNENLRDKISNHFHIQVDLFDLNSGSSIRDKVEKEAIYV